jgi:MftR C-terminal domain
VSKSTFSRIFEAKEAAGIEAEAELWTAYLATLAGRTLSGPVLGELHAALAGTVAALDPGWDSRFIATRLLIAAEPALLRYAEWYRVQIRGQLAAAVAGKLGLDPDDLRPLVLAELIMIAFRLGGRPWVYQDGKGGREALLDSLAGAVRAVPASLDLSASGWRARA